MGLVGCVNAGYEVIEQGQRAVIAKKIGKYGTEYVAWHYHIEEGQPAFYWGRYGTDYELAKEAYNKKERGEYSG